MEKEKQRKKYTRKSKPKTSNYKIKVFYKITKFAEMKVVLQIDINLQVKRKKEFTRIEVNDDTVYKS